MPPTSIVSPRLALDVFHRSGAKPRSPKGFTLLEALVVIAMMGAIALMTAPFLASSPARKDLELMAAEAVDALREAQSSAMSGRNNARYGVHFEAAKLVIFQGATYAPADPNNLARTFPGTVTITAVTLSPGGACTVSTGGGNCDVHFATHRGTPTESGTVTFTDSAGNVKTVTVNVQGMIESN